MRYWRILLFFCSTMIIAGAFPFASLAGIFDPPVWIVDSFSKGIPRDQVAVLVIERAPIRVHQLNNVPVPQKGTSNVDMLILLPAGKVTIYARFLKIEEISLNAKALRTHYQGELITNDFILKQGRIYRLIGNVHGNSWSMQCVELSYLPIQGKPSLRKQPQAYWSQKSLSVLQPDYKWKKNRILRLWEESNLDEINEARILYGLEKLNPAS